MSNLGSSDTPVKGSNFELPAGAQIDEDNGDAVIRDSSGNISLRYNETTSTWELESLSSTTLSTEKGVFSGRPWFDVTEYGAVGDGVTDDGPAIQDAVDAASTSEGMSIVYYPEPDDGYLIDTGVFVQSDTAHIAHQPWVGAKIYAGPNLAENKAPFQNTVEFQNVYFYGLEVDGSQGWDGQPYHPSQKCIFLTPGSTNNGTKNLTVEYCYLHDSNATALGCDSIINQRYQYNIVENAGTDGQTQGSNGIGIGVGQVTGECPTWIQNNVIRDTAEFGIILEQSGDTARSHEYHINGNVVGDARIGIGVELVRGADVSGNTIVVSDRMERAFIADTLDGNIGPDQVSADNNHVMTPAGSSPTIGTAVFEWGADAAFGSGTGNTIETGVADYAVGNGFVNDGAYCSWGGVGEEGAGFGATPTLTDRWGAMRVSQVVNTDDGVVWSLDPSNKWRQLCPASSTNLSGQTASKIGFEARDDGTNTPGDGSLCVWVDTDGDGNGDAWLAPDGTTFT